MIFVSDKFLIRANQTVIITMLFPETSLTNIGEEQAVLEQSDDGVTWTGLLSITPRQTINTTINTRYVRLLGNTMVYAHSEGVGIKQVLTTPNPNQTTPVPAPVDLSAYYTKKQVDDILSNLTQTLINGADSSSDTFKELADKIAALAAKDVELVSQQELNQELDALRQAFAPLSAIESLNNTLSMLETSKASAQDLIDLQILVNQLTSLINDKATTEQLNTHIADYTALKATVDSEVIPFLFNPEKKKVTTALYSLRMDNKNYLQLGDYLIPLVTIKNLFTAEEVVNNLTVDTTNGQLYIAYDSEAQPLMVDEMKIYGTGLLNVDVSSESNFKLLEHTDNLIHVKKSFKSRASAYSPYLDGEVIVSHIEVMVDGEIVTWRPQS